MNRRDFLTAAASAGLLSAAGRPPNLLFLIADQLRADALRCYGNSVLPTPNLDRLAREGVRFATDMCPFPVCVPSRTGMLTGKSSANTGVHGNLAAQDPVLDPGPSFDNLLHDRGYRGQYWGKWHAPYKMARTYDNHVLDVPNEHRSFLAFLDQHAPQRPPHRGELLDKFYQRAYRPYPVDTQYADAQAGTGALNDKHANQQETVGVVDVPDRCTDTAFTVERSLRALDELKGGPFSLTCSISPPHPPFLTVARYTDRFPWQKMPVPRNFSDDLRWSPYRLRAQTMAHFHKAEYVQQQNAVYFAMIAEIDEHLGRLLTRLDDLGLARNTLVVFTADHGEMGGSHGLVSKMVFYEEAVHVPMLMRLPGVIQPGTVVQPPVSGLDLFATVLDYLGVPAPARDGDSLRPLIEGRGHAGPDYRVAEWATRNVPNYMVRTVDWKLMMPDSPQSKGIDALYDLRNDPYEMRNLLGDPADRPRYAAQAREMKDRLVEWLARVHSPALEGVKSRKLAG